MLITMCQTLLPEGFNKMSDLFLGRFLERQTGIEIIKNKWNDSIYIKCFGLGRQVRDSLESWG